MQTTKTGKDRKAGKVFLNIEIDPKLRSDMTLAAMHEGKTLKEWLPSFMEAHLPRYEIVPVN